MRVIVEQAALRDAVGAAGRAASAKAPLPILGCLHLSAEGETLTVIGADYELQIAREVPAQVEAAGAVAIPAKGFGALVDALPAGPVTLLGTEEDGASRCHLEAGAAAFDLLGLPAEGFPPLPILVDATTLSLPAATLKAGIERVAFAAGTDPSRPQLTGMNLVAGDGILKLACAEMSNLSIWRTPLDDASKVDVILPMKAVGEIARALGEGEVEITLTANHARFERPGVVLVSRLIDGKFPNFEKVIPKDCTVKVSVNADALRAAGRRILAVADDARRIGWSVRPDGAIDLRGQSAGTGSGEETLDAEVTMGSEEVFSIALDGGKVHDLLGRTEAETLEIEFTAGLSPVVFHPESDWVFILMPMYML